MKIKPKEILVNLPAAHLFQSEDEMASFASAINTIIFGKSKIKYEALGLLGGQYVGLFYIQRNLESQQIHDEFIRLIEQEEMGSLEQDEIESEPTKELHGLCLGCDIFSMLHLKELDHCVCGSEWIRGKCQAEHN